MKAHGTWFVFNLKLTILGHLRHSSRRWTACRVRPPGAWLDCSAHEFRSRSDSCSHRRRKCRDRPLRSQSTHRPCTARTWRWRCCRDAWSQWCWDTRFATGPRGLFSSHPSRSPKYLKKKRICLLQLSIRKVIIASFREKMLYNIN